MTTAYLEDTAPVCRSSESEGPAGLTLASSPLSKALVLSLELSF